MLKTAYGNVLRFLETSGPEALNRPLPEGPVMGGQPVSELCGRWSNTRRTIGAR